MSYDLAVWEAIRPAIDRDATTDFEHHYHRYAEAEPPPPPTPRIRRFVEALLARWPDHDGEADPAKPWAIAPLPAQASGPLVYLPLVYSRAAAASPFIATLAWAHALITYDPQLQRLLPPALDPAAVDALIRDGRTLQAIAAVRDQLGCELRFAADILDVRAQCLADGRAHPGQPAADWVLTTADRRTFTDPNAVEIGRVLTRLNRDCWHAILERRDGWFVQVGVGEQAGTRAGWYALERQDGDPGRHYHTTVTDLQEIIVAFTGFAAGDPTWTRRFAWQRLRL